MSLDILNMSDEEVMKMDPESFKDTSDEANQEDTTEDQTDSSEGQASEEEAGDEGAKASDESGEDQAAEQDEGSDDEEENTEDDSDESDKGTEDKTEPDTESKEESEEKAEDDVAEEKIDYEAQYKRLTAPFIANGKEMSVKSVEEAISLMQMGANYHKKMAALKPNLKLMKLLDSNGLLSEDKLGYLIDLANKDAGAINKLVQDSGIDPMDLSSEKADEYRPTSRSISDKEIELDAVLEEIQDSPAYQRTLKVVGKDWDVQSRQIVADAPQLLKIINGHVQTGIYDMIVAEVERERMFGRLNGATDLEAYKQVGDAIQARGGFDHLVSGTQNQGQQTKPAGAVVAPPKPKQADENKLKDKRRAAAPTKPAANGGSSSSKDFNPLAMSDEEFAKLAPI